MASKMLYCIRHGLAVHNVLHQHIGKKAFTEYYDTPLLHEGYMQADALCKSWKEKEEVELILVSPLMRTLQTCVNVFQDATVPIIALDSLMEYPFWKHENCNRRKPRSLLESNFPSVDFSNLIEFPEWKEELSTIEDLDNRTKKFVEYLDTRSETKIAIVSHSSWLNYFLYKDTEFKTDLEHCYPYTYTHITS